MASRYNDGNAPIHCRFSIELAKQLFLKCNDGYSVQALDWRIWFLAHALVSRELSGLTHIPAATARHE